MGGYALQNPSVPLKSGKPESTPIPAPAQINRAPALSIISAARFRSSSKLISSPRHSNPMLHALCLFNRLCQFSRFSRFFRLGLALSDQLSAKNSTIRNSKSQISHPKSHISHPKSPCALRPEPCAFSQSAIRNPKSQITHPTSHISHPKSHIPQSFSDFKTATKACWGIITEPTIFMRFLPFFCFSRSLRLRVTSPP